jgi:hypothetical protein
MSDIDEIFDNSDSEGEKNYGSSDDESELSDSGFVDRSNEWEYLETLKDTLKELETELYEKKVGWSNYFPKVTDLQKRINDVKIDLADDLSVKEKQKKKKKIDKFIRKLLNSVQEISEHHPDRAEKLGLFREDMISELENIVKDRLGKSSREKISKTIPEFNEEFEGFIKLGRELDLDEDEGLYFVFDVSATNHPKLFKKLVKSNQQLSDSFYLYENGNLVEIFDGTFENLLENHIELVYKLPLSDSAYKSVDKSKVENVPKIIKNLQELVITFPDLRKVPIDIVDVNEAADALEKIQDSFINRRPYSSKNGNPIFLTVDEYLVKYVNIFSELMIKKAIKARELDPSISRDIISDVRNLFSDILQKIKGDKDLVNNSQELEKKLSVLEDIFYKDAQEYEDLQKRRLEESDIKELYTIYKKAKSIGVGLKSSNTRKHSDEELDNDFATGSYSFIMKKYGDYLGSTKNIPAPTTAQASHNYTNDEDKYEIIPYKFKGLEYSINKSAKALDGKDKDKYASRISKSLGLSKQEREYIEKMQKEKSLIKGNLRNILNSSDRSFKKEFVNVLKDCAKDNDIDIKGSQKINYINNLYGNSINIFEFKVPDVSFKENSKQFLNEISKNGDLIDEIFGDPDHPDGVVNNIGTFYKGQEVTLKTKKSIKEKTKEARVFELEKLLGKILYETGKLEKIDKSDELEIKKSVSIITDMFQEFYGPGSRFIIMRGRGDTRKFKILIRSGRKNMGETLSKEEALLEIKQALLLVKNDGKPTYLLKPFRNFNTGTIIDLDDDGLVRILMNTGNIKMIDPEMIEPIVKLEKRHDNKINMDGSMKRGIPTLQPMFSAKTLFKKGAALRLWASKLISIENFTNLQNIYEIALFKWYKSLNPKITSFKDLESMGLAILEDNVVMEIDTDKILENSLSLYKKLKNKENVVEEPPDVTFLKIKEGPTPNIKDFEDSKFSDIPSEYYVKNMNEMMKNPEIYGFEYVIPLDKYKNELYEKLKTSTHKTMCEALKITRPYGYFRLPNTDEAVLDYYNLVRPNKKNIDKFIPSKIPRGKIRSDFIPEIYTEIIIMKPINIETENGLVPAKWSKESVESGKPQRVPLTLKDLKDLEQNSSKFFVPQFKGSIGPTFKVVPDLLFETNKNTLSVECSGKKYRFGVSQLPGEVGKGWFLNTYEKVVVEKTIGGKVTEKTSLTNVPVVFTDFDEYLRAYRKYLFDSYEKIKDSDKSIVLATKKIEKIEKITDYLGDIDYSEISAKIKKDITPHGILRKELQVSKTNLKKLKNVKVTLENDSELRSNYREILYNSMVENSNVDQDILYEKATSIEAAIVTLYINNLKINDLEKRSSYVKKINELTLVFKYDSKIISLLFSGVGSGPSPFVSDKSITVPELVMIEFTEIPYHILKKSFLPLSLPELLKWKPKTPMLNSEISYAKKMESSEVSHDKKRARRVRKDSKEKHPKTWARFKKLKINVPSSSTSLEVLKSLVNTSVIIDYDTVETYETISKRDLTLLDKKKLVNDILDSRRWNEALKRANYTLNTLKVDKEKLKEKIKLSKFDKISKERKKQIIKDFSNEKKEAVSSFLNDIKMELENPMNMSKISFEKRSTNQKKLVNMVKRCFPENGFEELPYGNIGTNDYSKISEIIEDACYNMTETLEEYDRVFYRILNQSSDKSVRYKFCQLVFSADGGSVDLIVNLAELYMSTEEESLLKRNFPKSSVKTFKTDKRKFFEDLLVKSSPTLLKAIQNLDITRSAIDYYDIVEPVKIGQISDLHDSFTESLEKNYFKRVLGNVINAKQLEQQILINKVFNGSQNVGTMSGSGSGSSDTKPIEDLLKSYVHKGLYKKELGFKSAYDNYMKNINEDLKNYQVRNNVNLTKEEIDSLKSALMDGLGVKASLRKLKASLIEKYPEFSKYVNQQDLIFSKEFVKELNEKMSYYVDYQDYVEPIFAEKIPLGFLERGVSVISITGGFLISGSLPMNPVAYRYKDSNGLVKSNLSKLYRKYIKEPLPSVIFRIGVDELLLQGYAKDAKEGIIPNQIIIKPGQSKPSDPQYTEYYYGIRYPKNFNIESGEILPKEDIMFNKIKKYLVENQTVINIDLKSIKMFYELVHQERLLLKKEHKIKKNILYIEKLIKDNVLKEILLKKNKDKAKSGLLGSILESIKAREETTEGLKSIVDELKKSKDRLNNDYKKSMKEFTSGPKYNFLNMLDYLCKQLYPTMSVNNMSVSSKYTTCISNAIDFKDVFLGLDLATPEERQIGYPFKSKLNKSTKLSTNSKILTSYIDGSNRRVILSDTDYPVPVSYLDGKPVFYPEQKIWLDHHLKNGTMSSWLTSRISQLDESQRPFYIKIGPKASAEFIGTSNYYVELEFSDPVYPRSYMMKVGVPDTRITHTSNKNLLREFVSKDEKKRLKYYLKNQERGSRLYQVEAEKEYEVSGKQITEIHSNKSLGAYGLVESRVLSKPIKGSYKVDVWEWSPEASDKDIWTLEVIKVQKDIQNKLRQYGIQSSAFIDFKNKATHYLEKFRYNLPTEKDKRIRLFQKPTKAFIKKPIKNPTMTMESDDQNYVNEIISKSLVIIPELYKKLMKNPHAFKLKDGSKPFEKYYRIKSTEIPTSIVITKESGGKKVAGTDYGIGLDELKVYDITALELFKNMDKTVDLKFTGSYKKYSKNLQSFNPSKNDKKPIDFIFTILKNKGFKTVTFFEFLKAVVDFSRQVEKINAKKNSYKETPDSVRKINDGNVEEIYNKTGIRKIVIRDSKTRSVIRTRLVNIKKPNDMMFNDFHENSFRIQITLEDILSYMGDSFMQYSPYRYGIHIEEIDKPGSFGDYKEKITKTTYLTTKCRYVNSMESSDYKSGGDILQINFVNEDLHSSESVSSNLARRAALFYEMNLDTVTPCFSDDKRDIEGSGITRESDHAIIKQDVLLYLKSGGSKRISGADERGLIKNFRYHHYAERKAIMEYTKPYKIALYSLNNKRLHGDIDKTAENYRISSEKLEEYWEIVNEDATSKEARVSFIKDNFWLRPEVVNYRWSSLKPKIEKEFEKATTLLDQPMALSTILDGSTREIEIADLVKSEKSSRSVKEPSETKDVSIRTTVSDFELDENELVSKNIYGFSSVVSRSGKKTIYTFEFLNPDFDSGLEYVKTILEDLEESDKKAKITK